MKSLMKHIVLIVSAFLLLSACDTSPTVTPVPPSNPVLSTATVIQQPTGTVISPLGTSTVPALAGTATTGTVEPLTPEPATTGVATAPVTPLSSNVSYKHYNAGRGNWSIDYPQSWQTSVISPNVQFLEPGGNALIQVTYGALTQKYDSAELVQLASANLKTYFGDTYVQKSQEQQADGSTRIDFNVAGDGAAFNGQAIVGQRGTGLYILMLIDKVGTEATYRSIFERVLQSYNLPVQ